MQHGRLAELPHCVCAAFHYQQYHKTHADIPPEQQLQMLRDDLRLCIMSPYVQTCMLALLFKHRPLLTSLMQEMFFFFLFCSTFASSGYNLKHTPTRSFKDKC